MSLPQLFGIIPTGQPCITNPTSAPSQNQLLFTLPSASFNHIVVFVLPGVTLPPDTAAAVYLALPQQPTLAQNATPSFRFLGGIGPGKESAIFKVNSGGHDNESASNSDLGVKVSGELIIGISIEPSTSVTQQMSASSSKPPASTINEPSTALVRIENDKNRTLILAQRIIKNAFNFLASFSGNVPVPGANGVQGMEVVPLKAFEDWWKKFEGRVRNDPAFLEKETE